MRHQDVDLDAMWAAAVEANGGDTSDQHMDEFWDKLQVRDILSIYLLMYNLSIHIVILMRCRLWIKKLRRLWVYYYGGGSGLVPMALSLGRFFEMWLCLPKLN